LSLSAPRERRLSLSFFFSVGARWSLLSHFLFSPLAAFLPLIPSFFLGEGASLAPSPLSPSEAQREGRRHRGRERRKQGLCAKTEGREERAKKEQRKRKKELETNKQSKKERKKERRKKERKKDQSIDQSINHLFLSCKYRCFFGGLLETATKTPSTAACVPGPLVRGRLEGSRELFLWSEDVRVLLFVCLFVCLMNE